MPRLTPVPQSPVIQGERDKCPHGGRNTSQGPRGGLVKEMAFAHLGGWGGYAQVEQGRGAFQAVA